MSTFIVLATLGCLVPSLITAVGELKSRRQSRWLTREVARAFQF